MFYAKKQSASKIGKKFTIEHKQHLSESAKTESRHQKYLASVKRNFINKPIKYQIYDKLSNELLGEFRNYRTMHEEFHFWINDKLTSEDGKILYSKKYKIIKLF